MIRTALVLAAFFALVAPARAAFEDSPESARAAALGGAMTAVVDDPSAVFSNPAVIGQISRPSLGLNYARQWDSPTGKVDDDRFGFASAFPFSQELLKGAFGLSYVFNSQRRFSGERSALFSYATRSLLETERGLLDFGMTVKILGRSFDANGDSVSHGTVDLGALWRFSERYNVGLSLLNVTSPGYYHPVAKDRAPFTVKLGFSESVRGFLITADLTRRESSANTPASATLAGGLERWWSSARAGSFAARAGLSLGSRSRTASAGLGWRVFGGEAGYALTIPLTGAITTGHAASFTFRFGSSNPEQEYERVLADEIRYRRDLTQALESSEAKQWRLGEELSRLREELELLRAQLENKTASESQSRQRIRDLEQRRKDAEERFQSLRDEQKKLAERSQQSLYDEDWNSYLKLKLGGAPDALLVDQVKRVLRQYKDKGVDLSAANQELIRLLRSK